MNTQPPPYPQPSMARSGRPAREGVGPRVAALRAEIDASKDRSRQAVLHFELGCLIEQRLGNVAQAVTEYLAAYNLDPSFRPPLFALVRLFERRRSVKNLERLYEAEARTATTARDKASALIEMGALLEDHLARPDEAIGYYEEALTCDPSCSAAALMLERFAFYRGDRASAMQWIETRAELAVDPLLKAVLLTEVAWGREERGDLEGAFNALRSACALNVPRFAFFSELERLSRKHDRAGELCEALEGNAALASAVAWGMTHGQGSSQSHMPHLASLEKAASEAAARWREAARVWAKPLGNFERAIAAYDRALASHPDDVLLRHERMFTCEFAGDLAGAAEDARVLLERLERGPWSAPLYFRIAELAQSRNDSAGARTALAAALDHDPQSAVARAMLNDLMFDEGLHAERLERLVQQSENVSGEARTELLWQAAQVAADSLQDVARAEALFVAAAEGSVHRIAILRELFGAAQRLGAIDVARKTAETLIDLDIEDEERSGLMRELYELLRDVLEDNDSADVWLRRALESETCAAWAPDSARVHAAVARDYAMLRDAHRALAQSAVGDETAAAHYCAGARAALRAGDEDQALGLLRAATARSPAHPYAVAVLEELLRSRGEAEEVVALLRESAAAQEGAKAAETSLLLAGAAAEAAGDFTLAVQAYEDAADRDHTSMAPLWSLHRLARRTGQPALLLKALEAMSEREGNAGVQSRATFELAEHYAAVANAPDLAEASFKAVLDDPMFGQAAAVSIVLLPTAQTGSLAAAVALHKLAQEAEGKPRAMFLRALAGAEVWGGADAAESERAIDDVLTTTPDDRWAHYAKLRAVDGASPDPSRRAEALIAVANATKDPETRAELLLHGFFANAVAGADVANDAMRVLGQRVVAAAPESLAAAIAREESAAVDKAPKQRAEVFEARGTHTSSKGSHGLNAARGRALLASGRASDAMDVLHIVLAKNPADLASWEALRVAAREVGSWADIVEACDRLAQACDGTFKALLLEEGAAVLMDELGRNRDAEPRLRGALKADPTRALAYGRLHDLLAERNETAALLDLVGARIDVTDDGEELSKLFYEQARLFRSVGDLGGALSALENLTLLEADHAGGLALMAEIHVAREEWAEAAHALRTLARADVPVAQRRIAHLGAADFLENKLNAPDEAIAELTAIADLGLGDASLYARIAKVAERAGLFDRAVTAWEQAALLSTGEARARHERRAAALHAEPRQDTGAAVMAYRRALEEMPADLRAGQALMSLVTDPEERRVVSERFEQAVRIKLQTDPTDPEALRKLRYAAQWRAATDLETAALETLQTLSLASTEEETALRDEPPRRPILASFRFSEDQVERLRHPHDTLAFREVAVLVCEALAEVDRITTAKFGVSRSDRVSPREFNAVRTEIHTLAAMFGLSAGDFYVSDRDPGLLAVVASPRNSPTWVVGHGVSSPLWPLRRFMVGRLCAGIYQRILPLIERAPEDGAAAIYAAAIACEIPLAGGTGRPGVEDMARVIGRAMPRKVRKSLQAALAALPEEGRGVDEFCHAMHRTAYRAGLLLAGELRVGLDFVLDGRVSREAIQGSADARDLIGFWTSLAAVQLRHELGTAS